MRKNTQEKHHQLYLYLDYFKTDNENIHFKLNNLSRKKKLIQKSIFWHNDRKERVIGLINKLEKKPYSPINESRIKLLNNLLDLLNNKLRLEFKWHDKFMDELYNII